VRFVKKVASIVAAIILININMFKGETVMLNSRSQKTDEKSTDKVKSVSKSHAAPVRHRPLRQPVQPRVGQNLAAAQVLKQPLDRYSTEDGLPVVFPHGDFREVEWPGAILNGCDATGADFSAALLSDLCALGANFSEGQFEESQLRNAALCGANLTRTNLRHADFRNANLTWCNLRGANLFAVDLRGANLAWADLREADLREVNFVGAYYNFRTQWPVGFDPAARQMVCLAESR
jgi:uncharacterized protein YjbI with pentapeptide repeats